VHTSLYPFIARSRQLVKIKDTIHPDDMKLRRLPWSPEVTASQMTASAGELDQNPARGNRRRRELLARAVVLDDGQDLAYGSRVDAEMLPKLHIGHLRA
jgi:hypothetical protein